MVSIVEMHSYGLIPIIPVCCAFVLTDPLSFLVGTHLIMPHSIIDHLLLSLAL